MADTASWAGDVVEGSGELTHGRVLVYEGRGLLCAGWENEMDWDEFDKWWHKHDNTKEFGHFIRQMPDDQLYEAWEQALRLRKNQKFTEAWPLLAMLSELLGHAIADRENLLPQRRP
jgi:hypothetical protein